MKKIIICILLSLSLLLCSCSKNDNVNIKETNSKNYIYVMYGNNVYDNGLIAGENPAVFYDFETMEKAVLCSRPNCTHTTHVYPHMQTCIYTHGPHTHGK